jgi:hypothetical protein
MLSGRHRLFVVLCFTKVKAQQWLCGKVVARLSEENPHDKEMPKPHGPVPISYRFARHGQQLVGLLR